MRQHRHQHRERQPLARHHPQHKNREDSSDMAEPTTKLHDQQQKLRITHISGSSSGKYSIDNITGNRTVSEMRPALPVQHLRPLQKLGHPRVLGVYALDHVLRVDRRVEAGVATQGGGEGGEKTRGARGGGKISLVAVLGHNEHVRNSISTRGGASSVTSFSSMKNMRSQRWGKLLRLRHVLISRKKRNRRRVNSPR